MFRQGGSQSGKTSVQTDAQGGFADCYLLTASDYSCDVSMHELRNSFAKQRSPGGARGRLLLKVLLAHNAYQQQGGEEVVVEAESRLLAEHGHKSVAEIVGQLRFED